MSDQTNLNSSTEETVGGMAIPNAPSGTITPGRAGNTQQAPDFGQAQTGQMGQTNTPDFFDVVRGVQVATAMSAEGSKFVKDLRDYFEKSHATSGIKVLSLAYPAETVSVVSGDNAITLLFSEAIHHGENIPTIGHAKSALMTLHSVVGSNVRMCNTIVVSPQDYGRAEIMGAHISNALFALSSKDVRALNINSLKKYNLEISTNPQVYDSYVSRNDPHGVPARADLKLTVSVNVPRNRNNQNLDLFAQADSDKMEIAAIGAYVIFARTQNNGMEKFIPEVHISSIVAGLPFEGIIPLLLAMATDVFIDNQYWKTQFSDLGGPNSSNIGNLINDANTGTPWRAENLSQRDLFINTYCEPAVLLLDVVEGRARIPGIEQYVIPEGTPRVINSINNFLSGTELPYTVSPGSLYIREYTGYIQIGSQYEDSRWADYLNAMIHNSSQQGLCAALLSHYLREDEMVTHVRNLFPEFTLLYMNNIVNLSSSVLRELQRQVHSAIKTINGQAIAGTADVAALLASGQGFITNPHSGGVYSGMSTPFSTLYSPNGMQGNLFG